MEQQGQWQERQLLECEDFGEVTGPSWTSEGTG